MSAPDEEQCPECGAYITCERLHCVGVLRARLAEAEAENARLKSERDDLAMRLDAQPTGTRICDQPACSSAIVKSEERGRYCAAGHRLRWVAIDSQDDVGAKLAECAAALEVLRNQRDAARADAARERERAGAAEAQLVSLLALEPGRTDLAAMDCHICHHDPEARAICSACRPRHCHGCWARDVADLRGRAEGAEGERDEGRLALARIGALTGALRCPSCSKLHTDDGRTPEEQAWAKRPHRTHLCVDDAAGKGCGATWRQPHTDVVAGVARLIVVRDAAEALAGPRLTLSGDELALRWDALREALNAWRAGR